MVLSPNDTIARRAFELLMNELPSSAFRLTDEDEYEVPGKCEIKLRDRKKSVVLVWKSNGKDNELTTRKEFVSVLRTWFPGFEKCESPGKRAYFDQIIPSCEKFLCTMLEDAGEIANGICEVAGVEL